MTKQLTPFEQAEYNREQGMKRLAGILITQAWIDRLRALRAAKVPMSSTEEKQWRALITQAAVAQHQHFGYDA
jgi:hypothetical protein